MAVLASSHNKLIIYFLLLTILVQRLNAILPLCLSESKQVFRSWEPLITREAWADRV